MSVIDEQVQQALIQWFEYCGRDLPWRRTRDPYRVLVSEIMLQQTQVDRVLPKYLEFIEQFPTLEDLASASTGEVIRAWSGLGYNRRALNLQRACQEIIERFAGQFPSQVDELLSLPGIGPYTAGAIACFAFEQDVGFVDTNIRRVLHRLTAGPEVPESKLTPREVAELAAEAVPEGQGWIWNQALIELGALVCRSRSAACQACPVSEWCQARPTIRKALASVSSGAKKKAPAFETTSRYVRGRVVELLRADGAGLCSTDLARQIRPERDDLDWIAPYLAGLVADGLIEMSERRVAEDSPDYDGRAAKASQVRYRLPQ